MSSSAASGWQAVYAWRGGMWRPVRGIHEGLRCEDCNRAEGVMYRDPATDSYYCDEHKPANPANDRKA